MSRKTIQNGDTITLEQYREAASAKLSKYRNKPIVVEGIRFDSTGEAARYQELKLLDKGKEIFDLVLQPRFPFEICGIKVGSYVGDFSYVEAETGEVVVEDFKGMETPMFKFKKKIFHALYPFHSLRIIKRAGFK